MQKKSQHVNNCISMPHIYMWGSSISCKLKIYSCEISEQEDGGQNNPFPSLNSMNGYLLHTPLRLVENNYPGIFPWWKWPGQGFVQILMSRILFARKFSLISSNILSKARFYVRPGKQFKSYILIFTKFFSTYKITLKHAMIHSFKSQ